jgi:glycosyltransferase involved in cell wall biosynthesis
VLEFDMHGDHPVMKIVLINHYAGSPKHGMEYRPYYLAREWVRLGHDVTIVASSHSHVRRENVELRRGIKIEMIDGIRYCWFRTPSYQGNGIGRALNMLAFLLQLFLHRRMLASFAEQGAVVASSTYPFDLMAGKSIARKAKASLTYEVHDLWPLSPIELGSMSPKHPFIRVVQWAEDFAYRNADLVVSILPLAEKYMLEHGLAEGKFRHVPNGIDLDEWTNTSALPICHQTTLDTLREQGRFILGYAGSHGIANSLETVLRTAELLRQHPITFVLVGHGPEKERLQHLSQSLHLDNVLFLPSLPKSAIPTLLDQMDCLLITLRSTWIFRLGISPNKLMDYMMSGRPVIQAIDAGNDMVAESGCGISVSADSPVALADAVLKMAAASPNEREEMGRKGREYVQQNHDYRILAQQFLRFISPQSSAQQAVPPPSREGRYCPSESI